MVSAEPSGTPELYESPAHRCGRIRGSGHAVVVERLERAESGRLELLECFVGDIGIPGVDRRAGLSHQFRGRYSGLQAPLHLPLSRADGLAITQTGRDIGRGCEADRTSGHPPRRSARPAAAISSNDIQALRTRFIAKPINRISACPMLRIDRGSTASVRM